MTLLRDVAPEIISNRDRAFPRHSLNASMTARFAFPSSGASFTQISKCVSSTRTSFAFLALGCALTKILNGPPRNP